MTVSFHATSVGVSAMGPLWGPIIVCGGLVAFLLFIYWDAGGFG